VKNFTNFACGAAAGAIKFPRSSNRDVSAAGLRECLMEFTVFCSKKTIDGERFLKRIHVRIGLGRSFSAILTVIEK
jgi:hypothetical protein